MKKYKKCFVGCSPIIYIYLPVDAEDVIAVFLSPCFSAGDPLVYGMELSPN